jgi:acyl dehydratase
MSAHHAGQPDGRLYADDLVEGVTIALGRRTVTTEEIVDFASAWDPQPFHVDEEAGCTSRFGTVIGSGLHTMAIFQRMAVDQAYGRWAVIAGRALHDVQLTAPLRPGATVSGTLIIAAVLPVDRQRSLVSMRGLVHDGDIQLLSMVIDTYVARR